jgi:hypothetical protein
VSAQAPEEALLAALPPTLRATVEAARESGDWAEARRALAAAARGRPGPQHIAYGRLLLALDDFDGCRSVLDRLGPDVLDDPAELHDLQAELLLEEAATRWWSPVPGSPHQRVPTSRTAIDAVVDAVVAARALGPTSPATLGQIAAFERAVVWARGSARTGGLVGPLGAAMVGLLLAFHGARHGGGPWLGAAVAWFASAPLLVLAGARPQWQVNAAVVEGRRSLDDAALLWLAKGPPLLAPFGLAARLLVHGALAPVAVLHRSLEGRKALPPALLLGLVIWGFAAAPVLDAPVDRGPTPAPAAGSVRLGPAAWTLGDPPPEGPTGVLGARVEPVARAGRLEGLVVTSDAAEPPPLTLDGWAAGEESVLSPEGSRCRVTLRGFDAAGASASLRTTACPPGDHPRWTLELSRR